MADGAGVGASARTGTDDDVGGDTIGRIRGRAGDGLADAGVRRAALERRWLELTNRDLPGAAGSGWPVRLNHCFQRILLDHATGGVWYDAIFGRPAYAHAPDALLAWAVALGEDVLAGRADLVALNARSLRWRGKGCA